MKTYITFLILLVMTGISCTDSTNDVPDTSPDNFTLKIDGVQKTFTNVQVTESVFINEDLEVPTYNVLATSDEDNGEFVAFQVRRDYTGTEGLYTFIYNNAEGNHTIADNFNLNITSNTGGKLSGTFSGPLFQQDIEPSLNISEGSFNINY